MGFQAPQFALDQAHSVDKAEMSGGDQPAFQYSDLIGDLRDPRGAIRISHRSQ